MIYSYLQVIMQHTVTRICQAIKKGYQDLKMSKTPFLLWSTEESKLLGWVNDDRILLFALLHIGQFLKVVVDGLTMSRWEQTAVRSSL